MGLFGSSDEYDPELMFYGCLWVAGGVGLLVWLGAGLSPELSVAAAVGTLVGLGLCTLHRYTAWIPMLLTALVFSVPLAGLLGALGMGVFKHPIGAGIGGVLGAGLSFFFVLVEYRKLLARPARRGQPESAAKPPG